MAEIDVEAVLKKLTLAEKVDLLAGEPHKHHATSSQLPTTTSVSPPFDTLQNQKHLQHTIKTNNNFIPQASTSGTQKPSPITASPRSASQTAPTV